MSSASPHRRRGLLRSQRFGWRLSTGNHKIVAVGEGYSDLPEAIRVGETVAHGGFGNFEVYRRRGRIVPRETWGFRIRGDNHEIVATGEGYLRQTCR